MDKDEISQFMSTSGQLFKVTNNHECHHHFQYQDGLNKLPSDEKFCDDKTLTCVSGRLYFTNREFLHKFYQFGVWLREINLPTDHKDFQMVQDPEGDKWGTNMLYLGKKYPLYSLDTFKKFNLQVTTDYINKAYNLEVIDLVTYLCKHYSNLLDHRLYNSCLELMLQHKKYDEFKSLVLTDQNKYIALETSMHDKILDTNNADLIILAVTRFSAKYPVHKVLTVCDTSVLDRLYAETHVFSLDFFDDKSILYEHEQADILEWLCGKGCVLTSDIMKHAIKNEQVGKVRWLAEHNCPYDGSFVISEWDDVPDILDLLKSKYKNNKFYDSRDELRRITANRFLRGGVGLFIGIAWAVPIINKFFWK